MVRPERCASVGERRRRRGAASRPPSTSSIFQGPTSSRARPRADGTADGRPPRPTTDALDGLRPGDPAWAELGAGRRLPRPRAVDRRTPRAGSPTTSSTDRDHADGGTVTQPAARGPRAGGDFLRAMPASRRRARASASPALLAACGGDDDGGGSGGGGGGEGALRSTTGRPTSTSETVDLVRARRPGIDLDVHRGLQRQQRVLRQEPARPRPGKRRSSPTSSCPTYWLAARLIGLGWVQKLPARRHPQRGQPRAPTCRTRRGIPTGEFTLPWQSGMTGIAYNIEVTGRELTQRRRPLRPRVQGQDRHAHRDARHRRPRSCSRRASTRRSATFDDAERGLRQAREGQETTARSAQFTGNDYHGRPHRRELRRLRRLVGRRRPARARQPGPALRASPRRAACGGPTRW